MYGGGRPFPIRRSVSAFVARMRPGSPPKRRSSASAAEWKVDARTPSTPSAASRPRSSPAALSVNVTATISAAGKAPLATCHAMRRVIVVVLPVPAPASTQTGPRVTRTAACCSGFSPAKIRSSPTSGLTVPRPPVGLVAEGRQLSAESPAWTATPPATSTGAIRCASPALVAGGVLVVAAAAAGALYVWLGSYAPLAALDTDFAPGSGVGAEVQPIAGSGGKPVFFPAYRRGRALRGGVHAAQHRPLPGDGHRPRPRNARPTAVGRRGDAARHGLGEASATFDLVPFQDVKLARGDTAILVVRYRLDCVRSAKTAPDVYSDRVRLRFSYLSLFHRTQTVTLPFAVTLRCVGGPPATP